MRSVRWQPRPRDGDGPVMTMAFPDLDQALDRLTSVVVVQFTTDGVVQYANVGFRRLIEDTVVSAWQVFTQPGLDELLERTPATDAIIYEGRVTVGDPNGEMRTLTGTVYRDGDTLLLVLGYDVDELERLPDQLLELNEQLDITQRELVRANRTLARSEATIRKLSLTDALTGVDNRRSFDDTLAEEIARAQRYDLPLSLVLLDLDHFKRVNDTRGHQAGDAVLKDAAKLLHDNVRQTDRVARTGGEEFAVVMPGLGQAEAVKAADRLRAILAAHPIGEMPAVTASFGVAALGDGDTSASLYRRADKAMYAAKQAGRNRVCGAE